MCEIETDQVMIYLVLVVDTTLINAGIFLLNLIGFKITSPLSPVDFVKGRLQLVL
jgi:hypothetical protein